MLKATNAYFKLMYGLIVKKQNIEFNHQTKVMMDSMLSRFISLIVHFQLVVCLSASSN